MYRDTQSKYLLAMNYRLKRNEMRLSDSTPIPYFHFKNIPNQETRNKGSQTCVKLVSIVGYDPQNEKTSCKSCSSRLKKLGGVFDLNSQVTIKTQL